MDHTMRPKPALLRYASLLPALLPALLAPFGLKAQTGSSPLATPSVRITAPVTGDALVTLKGNTHPLAQARYDQGAVSPSLATGRMQLLLRRSPAQSEALREYMGQLQDPNAAGYHKWLTPATYGANFGIADQDLQTVEAWLTSQGFKVEAVPASRNLIQFSGTTGQVAQAFHTSIHTYVVNGETHHSNASDPQIPVALAPVIAGISPLNDFRAKAQHILGRHSLATAQNGKLQVTAELTGSAPQLTGTIGTNTPFLYVTPQDAATIYNAPNALNPNFKSGTARNGAGVNIGVAEYSDLQQADYQNYRNLFLQGQTGPAPQIVIDGVDPGVLNGTGDGDEALLDAEQVAALAPQSTLYFYSSSSDLLDDGLENAIVRAIEDNSISVLSISYGACENNLGAAGNAFYSELWQQAAAQGITPVISAGDDGSAGCDANDATVAQGGLAVSGFASTPYDIAVGGTDFDVLATNFSQYVTSATTQPNNLYGSALSYIPENPWNDSITDPQGLLANNTTQQYQDSQTGSSFTLINAGSGGASSLAVCTGVIAQSGACTAPLVGYSAPPFQSGVNAGGAAPAGVRYIPDVSLFAAPGNEHQAAWAFCSDNVLDGASTSYTDCVANPATGQFSLGAIGGTSASAPAFSGILGMVIQSLGANTRLGIANNVLYNLNAKGNTNAFNDVMVGNNSVPCTQGSPNCVADSLGNYFLTGYNAGTGYDLASGLGSVNITNLINAWPTATFAASNTAFQVNGATNPITVVHGTTVTLAAQVNQTNATGVISVTGNSNSGNLSAYEGIPITSNGGGSIQVFDLPGGTYPLHAYFAGDVTDAASTSNSIQVTVTPENSTEKFFLQIYDLATNQSAENPASIAYGLDGYAYLQPLSASANASNGTASGTATLLNNGNTIALQAVNNVNVNPQTLNSAGVAAFPLYALTPGTYSFSGKYSGDASYNASTSGTVNLTITRGPTQLTVTPQATTIAASGSTSVSVTLLTDSVSSTYPTGSITLTSNGQTFAASSTSNFVVGNGQDAVQLIFTVPGASLASGANTLTASYPGDGNYLGASATAALNVSGTASTGAGFNLTGPTNGVTVQTLGTAQQSTVVITPTNGFTGTVNLSCTVQRSVAGSVPSCTIAPSVNVAANTAASVPFTINTTGGVASLTTPRNGEPGGAPLRRVFALGGGVALCSMLLWGMPARRKSWQRMVQSMLLAAFAVGSLGILGCGGSSNNNAGGTPAGTYTATITGTSGSVTANTVVSVQVP